MSRVTLLWLKLFNSQTEIQKRLFAAEKSLEIGYGGIVDVSKLTRLSRTTITKGIKELKETELNMQRVRKTGSGRKKVEEKYSTIKGELENLYWKRIQ